MIGIFLIDRLWCRSWPQRKLTTVLGSDRGNVRDELFYRSTNNEWNTNFDTLDFLYLPVHLIGVIKRLVFLLQGKFCGNMTRAREIWTEIMSAGRNHEAALWLDYLRLERYSVCIHSLCTLYIISVFRFSQWNDKYIAMQ